MWAVRVGVHVPVLRVVHFSDTHLGHQQYARTDASGLNQREQDHYAAFHAVVDAAIASHADLVLHAGDLFDGVRPSNRALAHAQDGFLRLSRAGIPCVVIAGNHEHPKLRETGSALRLYEHLPGIHVAYAGQRRTFSLPIQGVQVRVHAVPQCADNADLAAQVAAIPRAPPGESALDILVVHGAVTTLAAFSHAEFNEQSLDPAWFDDRFAYVALGHFHGAKEVVAGRAWYSGAPERVSMAESGEEKGFLEVRLATGTGQPHVDVVFRGTPTRPYVDFPVLDAAGLDAAQVVALAQATVARAPAGAVARLRMRNLDPALRGSLDLRSIQEAGRHLLHLDLSRLEWRGQDGTAPGAAVFGHLGDEFEAFAARTPLPDADRAELVRLARLAIAGGVL